MKSKTCTYSFAERDLAAESTVATPPRSILPVARPPLQRFSRLAAALLAAVLALASPTGAEVDPPENAAFAERLAGREAARQDFLDGRLDAGETRLKELSSRGGTELRQQLHWNRQVLELALQLPVEDGHGPAREELGWRILERGQAQQEALLALPEEEIIETSSGDINASELLWAQYYETLGLALEYLIGDWEEAMVFYEAATQLDVPAATARKRLEALEIREQAMLWKQFEKEE